MRGIIFAEKGGKGSGTKTAGMKMGKKQNLGELAARSKPTQPTMPSVSGGSIGFKAANQPSAARFKPSGSKYAMAKPMAARARRER